MNIEFQEYATSTAFSVQLSKRMVDCLLWCRVYHESSNGFNVGENPFYNSIKSVATINALTDRGLIRHHKKPYKGKYYTVTKAGLIMCDLINEAGLKLKLRAVDAA